MFHVVSSGFESAEAETDRLWSMRMSQRAELRERAGEVLAGEVEMATVPFGAGGKSLAEIDPGIAEHVSEAYRVAPWLLSAGAPPTATAGLGGIAAAAMETFAPESQAAQWSAVAEADYSEAGRLASAGLENVEWAGMMATAALLRRKSLPKEWLTPAGYTADKLKREKEGRVQSIYQQVGNTLAIPVRLAAAAGSGYVPYTRLPKGKLRSDAAWEALEEQDKMSEVRLWTDSVREYMIQTGEDPDTLFAAGLGLTYDVLLDFTWMLRGPAAMADKANAVLHVSKLARKAFLKAGASGSTAKVASQELASFAAERISSAAKANPESGIYDVLPSLQRELISLAGRESPMAAEFIAKEFHSIGTGFGRRGFGVAPFGMFPTGTVGAGLKIGAAGVRGVSGTLRIGENIAASLAQAAGAKGIIVPSWLRPSSVTHSGGVLIQRSGHTVSNVGDYIVELTGPGSLPAGIRGRVNARLTSGPLGQWLDSMIGYVDPVRAMGGKSRSAASWDPSNVTDFDAFAARISFYESRRVMDNKVQSAQARAWKTVKQWGDKVSGRHERLRDPEHWVYNIPGVKYKETYLDTSAKGIPHLTERVAGKASLADEAGAVTSVLESTNTQAHILHDVPVEEAKKAWKPAYSGQEMPEGIGNEASRLIDPSELPAARNHPATAARARIISQIRALREAAEKRAQSAPQRAERLRAKAEAMEARLTAAESELGEAAGELGSINRRIVGQTDHLKLLGEHGTDPRRHRVGPKRIARTSRERIGLGGRVGVGPTAKLAGQTDVSVVSYAAPRSKKQAKMVRRLVPKSWIEIDPPKGMPTDRLYFAQTSGAIDLPHETMLALRKAREVAEKAMARAQRRIESLGGVHTAPKGATEARAKAEFVEDLAAAQDYLAVEKAEGLSKEFKEILSSDAVEALAMKLDRELIQAIKRAYSSTVKQSYSYDPVGTTLEVMWANNLRGVEHHFGVQLPGTWVKGATEIGQSSDEYYKLRNSLDARIAGMVEFADSYLYRVYKDLVENLHPDDAPQFLEAYVPHYIKNKDRILKKMPGKTYVSLSQSFKHRKIDSLLELKGSGYSPVEDIRALLAGAEYARINATYQNRHYKRVFGDRRWAVPFDEVPEGTVSGGTHSLITNPADKVQYWVPTEFAEPLLKMVNDTGDMDKLEQVGAFVERYLLNPWKGWATFARPAFHMRNAYSNLWLMSMGGYDFLQRPEHMSNAIKIGSLGKLRRLEAPIAVSRTGKVTTAKEAIRGARRRPGLHKLQDAVEDAWDKQLRGWADEVYTAADGRTFTGMELRRAMDGFGVINPKWQAADVHGDHGEALQFAKGFNPVRGLAKTLPFGRDSYVLKFGGGAGRMIENHARSALFMDAVLHQGMSPFDAARHVKKHLFDYGELTDLERKFLRRAIPFYTWARKATAHEFMALVQNPGKYVTPYKLQHAMESAPVDWAGKTQAALGIEEPGRSKLKSTRYDLEGEYHAALAAASDFIQRRNLWTTWMVTPWGSPVYFDPSMPFQEWERFGALTEFAAGRRSKGMERMLGGVLESIHPILKMPISLYADVKFPQRRSFLPYREVSPGTEALLAVLGDAGPALHKGRDKVTGEALRTIDERWIYAAENWLPHLAVWSRYLNDKPNSPYMAETMPYRKFRETHGVGLYVENVDQAQIRSFYGIARELSGKRRAASRMFEEGTLEQDKPGFAPLLESLKRKLQGK